MTDSPKSKAPAGWLVHLEANAKGGPTSIKFAVAIADKDDLVAEFRTQFGGATPLFDRPLDADELAGFGVQVGEIRQYHP